MRHLPLAAICVLATILVMVVIAALSPDTVRYALDGLSSRADGQGVAGQVVDMSEAPRTGVGSYGQSDSPGEVQPGLEAMLAEPFDPGPSAQAIGYEDASDGTLSGGRFACDKPESGRVTLGYPDALIKSRAWTLSVMEGEGVSQDAPAAEIVFVNEHEGYILMRGAPVGRENTAFQTFDDCRMLVTNLGIAKTLVTRLPAEARFAIGLLVTVHGDQTTYRPSVDFVIEDPARPNYGRPIDPDALYAYYGFENVQNYALALDVGGHSADGFGNPEDILFSFAAKE